MKERIYLWINILINITIIVITLVFIAINFENITYNTAERHPESTKSLNARYQYWLEDRYGRQEGLEICWKIEDFTIWIIKHHINEMFLVATILMILGSTWINKKFNKKMNKVLKVYFIICILLMLWTTFEAGPHYIDSIYDS